jgi:hypothetical protein
MKDETLQMRPFQGAAIDPSVRKDVEAACRALKIDGRILPVKEFRDDIKSVRDKTSDGTIVLVSEGGKLKAPAETTVVLSLETLQQTLAQAIERGITTATKRRGRPADFLVGLPKVPKSASTMNWELELGDDVTIESSDLEI